MYRSCGGRIFLFSLKKFVAYTTYTFATAKAAILFVITISYSFCKSNSFKTQWCTQYLQTKCVHPICKTRRLLFARDSIYAKRAYAIAIPSVRLSRQSVCLSVCPSVCPSHGWISQKRLKLESCNFHHTVAPSL